MSNQYLLQLMLSKGIGDVAVKKILRHTLLHQEDTWESMCKQTERLRNIIRCREDTLDSVRSNEGRAQKLYEKLQQEQVEMILETSPDYPTQLKTVLGEKCPPVLFAKGNKKLLSTLCVGFCGARKTSPKGLSITSQCAEQFAKYGITVISGYAAGTDMAAHTSAMLHGGNTIFVLAEGILRFTEKQAVKNCLTNKNHLFISQFLPQVPWNAVNAMKRNSVIIGLSQAMVLIESGKSGGTFAAGKEALLRNHPLFVIEYAEPETSAEGNTYFIEHGGQPIRKRGNIPNIEKVISTVENYHCMDEQPEQLKLAF